MQERPLLRLALTPRWILALLLAFAIAVIFALLGQWQLSRAIDSATPSTQPTETVVRLGTVASPQQAPTADALGQMVSVTGHATQDFTLLASRFNGADEGWWLVTRFVVPAGGSDYSLAVALGWAPTEQAARDAEVAVDTSTVREITGRYLASETPTDHEFQAGAHESTMAVPSLVNDWPDPGAGTYAGYLVASAAPAGLTVIDNPAPTQEVSLNWLNVFYAIEWVVFAGLAFFLWFRLLKDAHERAVEDAEEAAALAATGAPVAAGHAADTEHAPVE
jgi:surfeit locus 1 family protein